jgi:cell division protein FtsW
VSALAATLRGLFARTNRTGPVDVVLAALVIALIGFGVVMVYSASVIEATTDFGDPEFYLKRQVVYAAVALAVMALVSRVDYHKLRPFTYPGLAVVVVLLTLSVLGFGHTGGGAARWLAFGPCTCSRRSLRSSSSSSGSATRSTRSRAGQDLWVGVLPHLLIAGVLMILCLKQPDFGGAFVLLALTFTMLFVAGARLHWLVLVSMLGSLSGYWLVRFRAYRWDRIMAWRDMGEHRQDLAYQPFQSVMSFGSGELTGLGLGKGLQVLYLPEAHTDSSPPSSARRSASSGSSRSAPPTSSSSRAACARRCSRRTTTDPTSPSGSRCCSGSSPAQHGGRDVDPADQGADAALRQLRRFPRSW